MRRRLKESYTIQYICMSKGELGVLSKREVCHHEVGDTNHASVHLLLSPPGLSRACYGKGFISEVTHTIQP
jgi:hypothetical protein